MSRIDRPTAVYVISVAAELAGVHPQTLRIYERKGLVDPARTGAAAAATATPTSTCSAASRSSPTRGSTWPACSACSRSRPRSAGSAPSSTQARAQARREVAEVERRHRYDLVPVQQSVVLYEGRRR